MIDYLKKEGGYKSAGLTEQEKKELEHLRDELKKFQEIEKQENQEIVASEGSESESGSEIKSKDEKEEEKENEEENEEEKEEEINDKNESKSITESEDDEDPKLNDLAKNAEKAKKKGPKRWSKC